MTHRAIDCTNGTRPRSARRVRLSRTERCVPVQIFSSRFFALFVTPGRTWRLGSAEAMEPPARVLPDLPWDIVERVAVSNCRAGGLREWCSTWRATCRAFADTSWFERNVRGGVGLAVVPSEAYPTVQAGVSRARAAPAAVAAAVAERALRRLVGLARRPRRRRNRRRRVAKSRRRDSRGARDSRRVRRERPDHALGRSAGLGRGGYRAWRARAGSRAGVRGPRRRREGPSRGERRRERRRRLLRSRARHRRPSRLREPHVAVSQPHAGVRRDRGRGHAIFQSLRFRGRRVAWRRDQADVLAVRDPRIARRGCRVTDHGVAEMRDACVVEKNGTYGLCLERHGFARVDTRTAKALRGGLENPHEAVLTTPDSPGVVVVSDGDGATSPTPKRRARFGAAHAAARAGRGDADAPARRGGGGEVAGGVRGRAVGGRDRVRRVTNGR